MKDIFTKKSNQKNWIIALVVINLVLLGIIFLKPNNQESRQTDAGKLAETLKKELQLSDAKTNQLKALREQFFELEQPLSKLIRSERDSMNLFMFREAADTLYVKNIARRIAENEYRMELYRLRQSIALNNLLNKVQRQKLAELMKEIKTYFKPIKK